MNAERGGRQILMHGMALVLVGLVTGFVVPMAPYPRLALGAHIQFESNGVLFIVLAILLLTVQNTVGPKSIWLMLLSVWGTWLMVFSEVGNAWWGTTQALTISGGQAGAKGGAAWQELVVKLAHFPVAILLVLSWILLMAGFLRKPRTSVSA